MRAMHGHVTSHKSRESSMRATKNWIQSSHCHHWNTPGHRVPALTTSITVSLASQQGWYCRCGFCSCSSAKYSLSSACLLGTSSRVKLWGACTELVELRSPVRILAVGPAGKSNIYHYQHLYWEVGPTSHSLGRKVSKHGKWI